MEDEILVRIMIAEYLRECGYRVFEAGGAAEAITLLRTSESVDVVFSDIEMPGGMDGFSLANWVRANRPTVKVILTSGHRRSAEKAGELCGEGPLLEKPYHPEILLRHIRELLSEARGEDE